MGVELFFLFFCEIVRRQICRRDEISYFVCFTSKRRGGNDSLPSFVFPPRSFTTSRLFYSLLGIKIRVFFVGELYRLATGGSGMFGGGVEPLRHESSGATEKQRRTGGRRRGGGDVRWGCCGRSLGWPVAMHGLVLAARLVTRDLSSLSRSGYFYNLLFLSAVLSVRYKAGYEMHRMKMHSTLRRVQCSINK